MTFAPGRKIVGSHNADQIAFVVSGTLDPDATGKYTYAGVYETRQYFKRTAGTYFLWRESGLVSRITIEVGVEETLGWRRISSAMRGDYTAQGTATGTATVAQMK
jgi:hypothetical protein